ncbi:hypothetical protein PhCBS80983_g05403 [Powellomyces hirtus]|uniref:Uncharacterized protein n=1 Tax=Powellomyces hirtus TaxID=109895 RepID=A0A507DU99_9FUNG|nr:hypothetical protein PhCBS80983_g05403 [Powellomyces hirtus]
MLEPRALVQHCRGLLSQHDAFARGAFKTGMAAIHTSPTPAGVIPFVPGHAHFDLSQPVVRTEAHILDDYFAKEGIVDEADRTFLAEVLNGCVRHKLVLEVALNSFYVETGERLLRPNYNLYAVLFYLTLFRLSDLGFPKLRCILLSYASSAGVHTGAFARFVFDAHRLTGVLRDAWNTMFDAEWVRETIVDPVLACLRPAKILIRDLEDREERGMVLKKTERRPTEPEPFLLTKPKPRRVPPPTEIVPNVVKARPVPRSVYQGSGEREALERTKAENREKQKQTYAKSSLQQFSVLTRKTGAAARAASPSHSPPPPATTRQPYHHRPIPHNLREVIPVKLTTAAILREDALVRRQRMEEEQWLNEVEMGLKDGGEFREWRDGGRAKEEEEKRLEMERRRLEIQLIHEDAYEAKQDLLKENRERAAEILAERETLRAAAEVARKEQEEENRKRVDAIQGMQGEIQKAKMKVVADNSRKAADITQQTIRLRQQAAQEQEAELARKAELIAQIRLLERSMPSVGTVIKVIDPTETSNLGLLSEMSVTELQERLLQARVQVAEDEARRREEIVGERKARVEMIGKRLQEIEVQRNERRRRRRERDRSSGTTTATSGRESAASMTSAHTTAVRSKVNSPGSPPQPHGTTATTVMTPTPTTPGAVGTMGPGPTTPGDRTIALLREKLQAKRTARLAQHTPVRKAVSKPVIHFPPSEWNELDVAERNHQARRRRREGLSEEFNESVEVEDGDFDGAGDVGWDENRVSVPVH